jgi:ligand-binding SRPBCC domain-containing protein
LVVVQTDILIQAPIETCFDLARNIDVHTRTVWKHTNERAVGGVTRGMIGENETVTFQARHFLIKQRLTSRITQYRRPWYFVDQMVQGTFKSLKHEHLFEERGGTTLMTDRLTFEAPFGFVGRIVERWVLKGYMRRFIVHRNLQLKKLAEEVPLSKNN